MSDVGKDVPFFEHLIELRSALIKSLVCILIVLPFALFYSDAVLVWFLETSCPVGTVINYHHPFEAFIVTMKIALLLAMFVTVPFIAYQAWSFVSPGLYGKERYALSRFAFASWLFFILGAAFNMLYIFPLGVKFGMSFQSEMLEPQLRLQFLLGMAFKMTLGFGLMFQMPIAVYLLVVSGLVEIETLRKSRPYVAVVILILSAILTPPDAFSQVMMGLPTYLLFEGGIFFAQFARRKKMDEDVDAEVDDVGDLENVVVSEPAETPQSTEIEAFSEDDDFDDDYDPAYDDEEWDYESYSRSQELKQRKEKMRRKNRIRRIRGNG